MNKKKARYDQRIESWALSEIKDTFVVTYQTYLGTRSEYARAVHLKMSNPDIAKSNMVASLDAYFQNSQAAFVPYLKANETEIIKQSKTYNDYESQPPRIFISLRNIEHLISKFKLLPQKGMDFNKELLFFMGNLLTEWNMEHGYFRMIEISKEYHSEDDQIADIIEDESN